jgi:hypothetical protein
VQVASSAADIVFQGYDRGASAYKEYIRINDDANTTFAGTVTAGNLLSYGDGTNNNTFIQGRSSAGYYSGIKLARGAGNWSNDSNNHFGMVVTDNGLELAKFTALGDNATGKAVYMTMADGGNTTFSADVTAGSITDGTATLTSGALSGVTTISTSGNVTSSGGSISGFDAALNDQTSTSYSLQSSDNGKVVTLSNASAITLTIPSGLGDGFNCLIVQKGAGQITLSASGTTLINRQSHTKTAGQYAVVSIVNIGSDSIIVGGDTGS